MKLPAEVNLLGVAHYLEALEWQKEIVKVHTIFGGKNPHPNYLVGGMACAINTENPGGLTAERLAYVGQLLQDGKEFIEQALSLDWEVSFPPWHVDIKDAADAVQKYGRLATVRSIIQHATGNQLKARVKAKML